MESVGGLLEECQMNTKEKSIGVHECRRNMTGSVAAYESVRQIWWRELEYMSKQGESEEKDGESRGCMRMLGKHALRVSKECDRESQSV